MKKETYKGTNMWRIEVKKRDNIEGENLKKDILDFGFPVKHCEIIQIYLLYSETNIKYTDIELIARELLADKVWETYEIEKSLKFKVQSSKFKNYHEIEIAYNPGVTDPVTESVLKGIKDLKWFSHLNIQGITDVKTRKQFLIQGKLTEKELELIANKLLFNHTVQHIVHSSKLKVKSSKPEEKFRGPVYIDILNVSPDKLLSMSRKLLLGLNLEELKLIQSYFKKLGRNPTDVELETIAQTWSEHCVHKTFKSKIKFNGKMKPKTLFSLIKGVTKELSPDWCVSVFEDNAGIIKFTDEHNICFKVETHNHPSALAPYGGAGTGIGGVIRDILGTGLGAKPILNTDVFAFGLPDYPQDKVPKGMLHPLRIMKGVVAGVRDYGNKMGIPTANGAVVFDEKYTGNPLVYCGTVGIIPKDKCTKEVVSGDLIVLLGGRTGRDGIHGVTFASIELSTESEATASTAVQIGNPIIEKKVTDVLMKARDLELYRAITDCGGGGLSSAVGELAKDKGAVVNLENVPLKYEGLSYKEIWISEAQERMIIFVPKAKLSKLLNLCKDENVEATVIGQVTNDKLLSLKYNGIEVGRLDMKFLHKGVPLPIRIAKWHKPNDTNDINEPNDTNKPDLTPYLLKILSEPNVKSKEWIIRQYDHEVQGGSCVKPLVGSNGPADACVVRPLLGIKKGIVVGCGINPMYGKVDPYCMGASTVDEAIRNVVAVGANPERIALLDNFSWGNPDKPEILGELVRTVEGCCAIAKAYKTPFISGKDSLNNEYKIGKQTISIPGTILISAIATIDDVNKAVTSDLKTPGNSIYILGKTWSELGASHYYKACPERSEGSQVPEVRPNPSLFKKLHQAMQSGLVSSCHDCSEGGIGVACAEMCIGGELGMQIELAKVPCGETITRNDHILFSESNTRFIIEIAKGQEKEFEKQMQGCDFSKIGYTTLAPKLKIIWKNKKSIISAEIAELKKSWQGVEQAKKSLAKLNDSQASLPTIQLFNYSTIQLLTSRPRALVLRTAGTNCDMETKFALELAGAKVDLLHINQFINRKNRLRDYALFVIPGGFTYGDDVSAGKILANELKFRLKDELEDFVSGKRLIIGICNGFQVLLKLGLLPAPSRNFSVGVGNGKLSKQTATLTNNVSGVFQCEWIRLEVPESPCVFTKGLNDIDLPIAHGEGRFVAPDSVIKKLKERKQIALYYKGYNPNGSMENIAGICDPSGRIFGLMPHPERFIFKTQHPHWTKNKNIEPLGLLFFKNAVEYVGR